MTEARGRRASDSRGRIHRLLTDPRATVAFLAVFLVVLALRGQGRLGGWLPLLVPLAVLILNLLATLHHRWRSFSRKPALLGFHVVLILLCLVASGGQLVRFENTLDLAEGLPTKIDAGRAKRPLWSLRDFSRVDLRLHLLDIEYWGGGVTRRLRAVLSFPGDDEKDLRKTAATNEPVEFQGLEIGVRNPTGFALLLSLTPTKGRPLRGVVLMPPYRDRPDAQEQELNIPGLPKRGRVSLDIPRLMDEREPWRLVIPERASILVEIPDHQEAILLSLGEAAKLPTGELRFEGLRRYARFHVRYDPTESWVLLLMGLLPLSLVWHYGAESTRRGVER